TNGKKFNAPLLLTFHSVSSTQHQQIYAVSTDGHLYCLDTPDPASGTTAVAMSACSGFSTYAAGNTVSASSPWGTVGSGGAYSKIYFGDDAGHLHCVSATTGAACWTSIVPATLLGGTAVELGQPIVNQGTTNIIYVGDKAGRVFKVSDS